MKRNWIGVGVGLGVAVALCGCARDLNNRLVLGGDHAIGALDSPAPGERGDDGASLVRMDRADWGSSVFVVPVDGTVHGATRRFVRTRVHDRSRGGGLFPTRESAIELDAGDGQSAALRAAGEPFVALGEALVMPLSLVLHGPGEDRVSPRLVYKRYPDGGWSSAGGEGVCHVPEPTVVPVETGQPPTPAGGVLIESIR